MSPQISTLLIITTMFIALVLEAAEPILIFFTSLVLLVTVGIIDLQDAVAGFSNVGVLTIGTLFILVGALQKSPYISNMSKSIFGMEYKGRRTILRFFMPAMLLSAFMNNTPLVSLFIPLLKKWCKRAGISPGKLLIPLSYISIFGGLLTLIGTSTNLIVSGMLENSGYGSLELFQITKVTAILAVLGIVYILTVGYRILPNEKNPIEQVEQNCREYLVHIYVEKESPIIGDTLEKSKLIDLEDLYLVEVVRRNKEVFLPKNKLVIEEGDTLIFTGNIKNLTQLEGIKGLNLAYQCKYGIKCLNNGTAELVEGVISKSFPFLHKKIDNRKFSKLYNSAIIAIIRDGERLKGRIDKHVLKAGDTVLLLAKKGFEKEWKDTKDFYLVTSHPVEAYLPKEKVWIPALTFLGVLLASAFKILPLLHASFLGMIVLFLTKIIEPKECVKYIDWTTLVVISLSFGIGNAMIKSGAASLIADKLLYINKGNNPYIALFLVYLMTNIFTELITNNAAAILALPIAIEVSGRLGISYLPFAIAVMIAASASFSSPYGYQTNLMVYGAGGYRFKDFIRVGMPLNLIFIIASVILIPIFYGFNV